MNNKLFAGAAKREITACVQSRSEVRDPLYVRTLVLDNGALRLVVMALDAVGIGWICDIPNDWRKQKKSEKSDC